MIFKRKKRVLESVAEQRFDSMMSLIKDLSKRDYEKLKKAMDLGYSAYQTVKGVRTEEEKELGDIDEIEKNLKEDK